MWNTRGVLNERMDDLLSKYTEIEVEAIQRCFLHFACVSRVPKHSHTTLAFKAKLEGMVEATQISVEGCYKAIAGIKACGISGPRSRKKEIFGLWEKDALAVDYSPSVSLATGEIEIIETQVGLTPASNAYTALVESFVVDDLNTALEDVEFARRRLKLGPARIMFFEFLLVIEACAGKNLQMLGKIFMVPGNMIGSGSGLNNAGGFHVERRPKTTVDGGVRGGRRGKKGGDLPPTLSLSQSLKFYNNSSATFASSPAPLRKPKLKNTGKTRLQKSEEEVSVSESKSDEPRNYVASSNSSLRFYVHHSTSSSWRGLRTLRSQSSQVRAP